MTETESGAPAAGELAPLGAPGVEVRRIFPDTPEYEEAAEVRWEGLYEPWDLPRHLIADTDGRTYVHVAAFADGRVVGYGRILLDGGQSKIFQLAVTTPWRDKGVGSAVMRALVEHARRAGRREVVLDARRYAIGFYETLGFVAEGPEFISGRTGTPHRVMRLKL